MIRRTLDGTFLTQVANRPDIRPMIGPGTEPVDLRPIAANPEHYVIEADHGGWLLEAKGPGVYEIHSLFLPEGRGAVFFRNAREMLRYMFARTDCTEIWTKCPDDNPGARMAALKCGFKEVFRRENCWGDGCGVSYQSLTIDTWAMRDAEALKTGHAFHEQLEAVQGSSHPEDEAHDRAVGAALLMVRARQVQKGVSWFNRWASFAGYAPVQALSVDTIATGDAIIEVGDSEIRVLLSLKAVEPDVVI